MVVDRRNKLATACERLAYLETFTKSLGVKARVKPPAMRGDVLRYSIGLIPRLEVQQLQLAQPE